MTVKPQGLIVCIMGLFAHVKDVQLHNIRNATQRAGQRDRRRDS